MFTKFRKRALLSASVLAAALLFICASVGISGKNEKVFTPRMTAPEYTNIYYYDDNVFYDSGFGIPNCTAYAWGRVYELLKTKPDLCTGNARDWYKYNKVNGIYPFGKKPELGAVACFDNDCGGHVAVVEEIDGDTITFSNSAYNGESFYLTYADIYSDNPGQDGWRFLGYIYPEKFADNNKKLNSLRRVSVSDGLNFRKYVGVNAEVTDVIPENCEIYISSFFEKDGYKWGKAYFRGEVGYCVIDYTVTV